MNRRLYQTLALLFVAAVLCQGTFTIDAARDLLGDYPLRPVWLSDSPALDVAQVLTPPAEGEVQPGDRLVAIGTLPVSRPAEYLATVRSHHPGESLTLSFEHAGHPRTARWVLRPIVGGHTSALVWLFGLVAWLLVPWLSLLLGFWVAAMRPRDPHAWLLLGMLAGLSQINRAGILDPLAWPPIIALPSVGFRELAVGSWGVWMMLFGIYFPQRWNVDRRVPWVKWIVGVPIALAAVWDLLTTTSQFWNPAIELPGISGNAITLRIALIICAVSSFFIAISVKYHDPALARDERRRLKLLHDGCTAALTPMFLLMMYTLIRFHRPPDDRDGVLLMLTMMALIIFPITMAYVIVVKRAMDVRMVVRQGLQYALARRSVRIVQIAITTLLIYKLVMLARDPGVSGPRSMVLMSLGVMSIFLIRRFAQGVHTWIDRRFFREAYDADRILNELSGQVGAIFDRKTLLETVVRRISESLHVERIAVLLREGGGFCPAMATGYPAPLDIFIPGDSSPDAQTLARMDSQLLLPLPARKEVIGFLSLGPKKSEEPYSSTDERLLRTVAAQTGLALENSRLSEAIAVEIAQREMLSHEIEIAREVQQRLFPQHQPDIPLLNYAGHCRPAQGVGGDYYDFLALASGRLGIAIGDVSGKGIPAALLMASLQASVRGQSHAGANVADLMASVSSLVYDASPENRYATFFYAQFDPATRRLTYSNGGHNAPILLRGAEVLRLDAGGPPVGLFRASAYVQAETELRPGDLLIFFTDGISEAENPAADEWGEDALIEAARDCNGLPPSETITRILTAADQFAAGAPQHDDMTLVIARVL